MVGKGALYECLDHPDVEAVLIVNRNPLGMKHDKLKEIVHSDFYDLSAIKGELTGYDACFFCLGTTSAGKSEEVYRKITYDLTMHFAKSFLAMNPDSQFIYVSGVGTDSTEKGRTMWARVKGKTENDILNLGFKRAYMFRPGAILPKRGIKSRTALYNFFYILFWPFFPIFKMFPKSVTDTSRLGIAMIKAVTNGYEKNLIEPPDIYAIYKS